MSQCQINYDYFRCRNLHTSTQHLQSTSTEVSKRIRSLLLFTPTPPNFGEFMVINPSKLKIQFKRDFCYQHPVYALKTIQMDNQSSL